MKVQHVPGSDLFEHVRERLRSIGPRRRPARVEREPGAAVEVEEPAPDLVRLLCAVSRWCGALACLIGYHGLLGWAFDIDLLRTVDVGLPPIQGHGALAAFLTGGALFLVQLPTPALPKGSRRPLLAVAGGVTTLLALLGILVALGGGEPGPPIMTSVSALAFLIVGVALLVLAAFKDRAAPQILGLASGAIAIQAVATYAYGAVPFPGQMPLYAAVAVLLVSVSLVFIRADEGFMAKIASNSFGGVMARRLLPATLLVPFVLGGLLLVGLRAGLYPLEPGLALLSVFTIVVFVAVVWWSVNSLYRMDTQRRQAERELKETAARLSRSNADLEQFAYVTSHDLKEPLRAISGSVQVLQSRLGEKIGPDAEEYIRHTVDGANRMQTLIDDLLTYSRLTTREAPLRPTSCEEVLAEVLANLEVPIRESKAVVTHDPLPTVPGDPTQLLQVFQNLVSNGIKYRSERTPKIHVGVEDRGSEWRFSVRDNGIGIAPQYADRIFKIFQRLHTRKDYPGTGIGLAVCKKVVERHGGKIWVESEPEEGSTFFFTIPKAPAE